MRGSIVAATAICLALSVSSSAWAKFYEARAVPLPGQELRFDHGVAMIASVKPHGAVRVTPAFEEFSGRVSFNVAVLNNGSTPVTIGVENVTATLADGSPARLLTYEDMKKKARQQARWGAVGAAIVGAASAYSTTSGSVTSSTPYGSYRTAFRATTYDPGMASAATQAQMDDVVANLNATLRDLDGVMLRTTTVDPGHSDGGRVVVDQIKPAKDAPEQINIRVEFNGDVHDFQFNVYRR